MKPLDRLKQQYKIFLSVDDSDKDHKRRAANIYSSIRIFCIDCNLISFAEIEAMEYELENSTPYEEQKT